MTKSKNHAAFVPSLDLIDRVAAGQTRAVARLITRAEAASAEARPALGEVYRRAGRAHVIGITGVPGSGKSTLVGKLTAKLREQGYTVAVVAIDPSSPYSGGAILGDRIRMEHLTLDEGVFIRSMATRGAVGGMAHAALDVVDVLDVAGFDIVIIETVGVGQDEVEIAHASHTTVVVSAPGLGDDIQAIKAGILEIADIHVVSKADRSDSNRTAADLKTMLKNQPLRNSGWRPPVLAVSSVTGAGLDALARSLKEHWDLTRGDAGQARREAIAHFRLVSTAEALVLERFRQVSKRGIDECLDVLAARQDDPYHSAERIVRDFTGD